MTRGSEVSLTVSSVVSSESVKIDKVLSVKHLPIALASLPSNTAIRKWPHLSGISFPTINASHVTILIGSDVPEVFWSLEERRGKPKEPYAVRSVLGCALLRPMNDTARSITSSFTVNFQQVDPLHEQLERMWTTDFSDSVSDTKTGSPWKIDKP